MSLLEETLAMIRRDSDIIIEVSTGGVSDLNIRERCAPLPLGLECGSLLPERWDPLILGKAITA